MKKTGLKRLATCLTLAVALVGCSRLLAQHKPEPGPGAPAVAAAPSAAVQAPSLEPGVERVTVGRVGRDAATIWWKSAYEGESSVVYGRDPHLMPVVVERTAPTPDRSTVLADLRAGTRYYFQVETATPLGLARSAIVSFRTVDAPPPAAIKPAKVASHVHG